MQKVGKELLEAGRELPPAPMTRLPPGKANECDYCGGNGYLSRGAPFGHSDFGKAHRCPRCNPEPVMVGVPLLYQDVSFDSFDLGLNPSMQEALERCRAVAAKEEWCALLVGRYGCGKTHLAAAALRASQWSRPGIYWESVTKFLDHVRSRAYGDDAEDIVDVLRPYERGDFLLVLDDIGIEKRTEWGEDRLYQVLDSRYSWRLPTILTTNAEKERIDGRIRSRYGEGLVKCRGRDVRASV